MKAVGVAEDEFLPGRCRTRTGLSRRRQGAGYRTAEGPGEYWQLSPVPHSAQSRMSLMALADDDFATTRWSVVLAAGRKSDPSSDRALADLCQSYWYPLYAYVRRRGIDADAARDLTQEFFARLLEKNNLAVAQPERGRFRAFLLTSLKNFLANEWERQRAQKRGGCNAILSLDFDSGESRFHTEPAHHDSPDRLFDRHWALAVLDHCLASLRAEFSREGKDRHFQQLKNFLAGEAAASYAQVGQLLGMTEGAVKVAVHRLRRRYRELLRGEVAQTLAEPAEVDDEIRCLFDALSA